MANVINERELQKLMEEAQESEFEYLVFPKRFYMMIIALSAKKRLMFYDAILDYYFTGEEPQLSIKDYSLWLSIKPDLDRKKQNVKNARRNGKQNKNETEIYENPIKNDSKMIQNRFKNDSKKYDVKKNNNLIDRKLTEKNESETTSETTSDYIYIKDKRLNIKDKKDDIKETYKEKRAKGFAPPSQNEVIEFFTESFFISNPDEFIDYYTANGWMVGKTKMKDWKAAARNWERKQKEFSDEHRTNPEKRINQTIHTDPRELERIARQMVEYEKAKYENGT